MAKQLNVNLVFNANTTQAKQQMRSLQTSFQQLQTTVNSNISMTGLTTELRNAQTAVVNLKTNLNSAFNVNTGKLDLTRFNQNLQRSGMTLKQYRDSLQGLGLQGQQAFNQLTNAIVQGQMPLHKTNNLLTSMLNTFGNTLKWSIASASISKISQGFSEAFQYAQDLNKSLTNIRVVTGKSIDEMARFADSANKAAKALGTTTTAYTDAALIYYQQGLDGKAVEERAKTTIKLANVTGQSAQQVSDQLTAVWNNFYDGSKSLEYYADALAALGAATASSSDEISQGLEKFAAVAETVGLSFEYATTALATITAETRQSADVVGTALKTLFARIQDLELGKTLEDQTTLGTYSEALKTAGVNIQTANGELKNMDQILGEIGDKWEFLDKGQQVALAKSVAGIRQYSQFIALMDNWDTFEVNLSIAEGAEGTLQDQQEIWAESWEAAQKRVKASVEDLYNVLVNDEFFIDLNNIFADLMTGVSDFTEAIGGLKTLLPMIAGFMMQAFGPQVLHTFSNFKNNLLGPSKEQQDQAQRLRLQALKLNSQMGNESSSYGVQAQSENAKRTKVLYEGIEAIERKLSQEEAQQLQYEIERNQELQRAVELRAQELDQLKAMQSQGQTSADAARATLLSGTSKKHKNSMESVLEGMRSNQEAASAAQVEQARFDTVDFKDATARQSAAASLLQKYTGVEQGAQASAGITPDILSRLEGFAQGKGIEIPGFSETDFAELQKEIKGINVEQAQFNRNMTRGRNAVANFAKGVGGAQEVMDQYVTGLRDAEHSSQRMDIATNNYGEAVQEADDNTEELKGTITNFSKMKPGEIFMGVAGGLSSVAAGANMAYSGIKNLVEMFKSGEHSIGGWLGVLTSLGFALPMIASGLSVIGGTLKSVIVAETLYQVATKKSTKDAIVNIAIQKLKAESTDDVGDEAIEAAANTAFETVAVKELNEELLKQIGLEAILNKEGKPTGKYRRGTEIVSGDTSIGEFFSNHGINANNSNGKNPLKDSKTFSNFKTGGKDISKFFTANAAAIGKFALTAGVLAVAIAAIGVGITLMIKGFNKHNKVAEIAAKNAAFLKKEYEGVVAETQKLNDNIEKYDELTNKVNSLVKGTYEYKQALIESNNAAMELIKSNKALREPGAYQMVNGEVIIDSNAMEKAQNEQLQNQQRSLASMNQAEITSNQLAYERDKTEVLRDVYTGVNDFNDDAWWGIGGGLGAAAVGTGLLVGGALNFWNPAGWVMIAAGVVTALGGITAIGSTIAGYVTGDSTEQEQKALEYLTEQYEDNPDMFKDEASFKAVLQGTEFESMADALWDNQDSIEELIQSNYELKVQNELLRQQIATAVVENRFENLDDRQKNALTTATANILGGDEIEKAKGDLYEEIKGQDDLVQDLYNYFHKDEGISVKTKSGDKATINKADGTTEDTTQSAIAQSVVGSLQQAVAEGDTKTIKEITTVIKDADGVSDGNVQDVLDLLDTLNIDDEIKEAVKNVEMRSSALDKMEEFSGSSNSAIHSQLLDAMAVGENDINDTDFSFLTREQLADLKNNIGKFDAETSAIIQKGLDTYEEKRVKANMKKNETFDSEAYELKNRLEVIQKAGLSDSEFEAFASTIADTYGVAEEQAEELAEANLRVKNGLTDLQETYKTYGEYLNDSYKGTLNYSKGVAAVQKNLNKWFGVTFETKTIEENLPDIQLALTGDIEAIERLQALAARELVIDIDLPSADETSVLSAITDLQNTEVTVGMKLDDTQAGKTLKALYESMYAAGLMSTEQIQSSLEALGYSVDTVKNQKAKTFNILGIKFQYGVEEIEEIDWNSVEFQGGFSEQAIDFLPDPEETAKKLRAREKERKELELEKERSYEIKAAIENLNKEYERLGKIKEQAFGAKKIALIKQEQQAIQEQIIAQKQLISETQNYLDLDRKNLTKYGVQTNAEGIITNFSDIENDYVRRLNAIEDMDTDQYEKLKEEYEEFKKAVEQYDSTRQELLDQELELIDLEIKEVENRLEEIDTSIELQVKISDASMRAIEYQLSRIEDKEYEVGAKIALRTQSFDNYKRNFEANQQGLADILSAHDISMEDFIKGDYDPSVLTQTELDKMEEIQEEMISNAEEMEGITTQLHEDYLTTFDYYNQKAEDAINTLDGYMSIIDSYRNILELTGTSMLGLTDEVFGNLYQITQANLDSQLSVTKSNLDFAKSVLADSETQLAAAQANLELLKNSEASEEEIKLAEDNVKLWEKNVSDAQARVSEQAQSYVDIVSNKIEKRIEEHQRLVDKSFEEFYKTTTGYSSLDEMQAAYDRQKKMSELYVDDYKKVYELSKLTRDINKSLDDTKLLKGKQALLKLEKQINAYQQDGVKMSQYQVENLRRQYELELAKIQLEEAQNAKTQVTLRQDSEGNWGYVYTANQDDIAAAEQNYEDKVYAIMEANDAYVEQTNANMIEAFSWLEDTIRAIDEDVTLSEEERQRKIAEAQNDFLEMQRFYSSEIDMVVSYNNMLYDSEAYAFEGAMERMENRGGAFIKWNEDVFVDSINTLTGNINDDYKEMSGDCQTWVSGLHDATGLAINGGDGKEGMISMFGNLGDEIAAVQSEGTSKLKEAAEDISNFTSTTNEKLAPLLEQLNEINEAFILMYQNQQDLANAKMLKGTTRTGHYEVNKNLTETDLANIKTYNSLGEVNTGYTGSTAFDPGQKVYGYTTYATPDGRTLYGVHTNENGSQVYISQDDFNEYFGSGWSSSDTPGENDTPGGNVKPGGNGTSAAFDVGETIFANFTWRRPYALDANGNFILSTQDGKDENGQESYKQYRSHIDGQQIVEIIEDPELGNMYKIKSAHGNYYFWYREEDITTTKPIETDPYPDSKYKKGMKIKSWKRDTWINMSSTLDGKAEEDIWTHNISNGDSILEGSEILEVGKSGEQYRYRFQTTLGNTAWVPGAVLLDQADEIAFNTGGYTGSWGPEGRWAMLHQKEIVLNAHDTENFLTAINIVRSMADQLDANAQIMSQGILRNINAILPYTNRDTLEQNVTIHAEFPNATNHSEIEEAFGNLVNLAAQYANNKY